LPLGDPTICIERHSVHHRLRFGVTLGQLCGYKLHFGHLDKVLQPSRNYAMFVTFSRIIQVRRALQVLLALRPEPLLQVLPSRRSQHLDYRPQFLGLG